MEAVLYVAAERRELVGLLSRGERWERLKWPVQFAAQGRVNGRNVLLVADGAGPNRARHAAQTAKAFGEFKIVVSTGFCGALDPRLSVADVFVARQVVGEADERFEGGAVTSPLPVAEGVLYSCDRVVGTVTERRRLLDQGCAAVEMEAAAVAACALEWGVPFYCLRVVSDGADHEFALDLNKTRDESGRFRIGKIIAAAIGSPRRVGADLWRLQGQSSLAAKVLGELLANCEFQPERAWNHAGCRL